jgi:hypothetical protein
MTRIENQKTTLEPVLVKVDRQGLTESMHRGSAIIYHATHGILAAWGNPDKVIFPRSAMKPIQVFTALSSGLGIADEQVAFGCASHHAEEMHIIIFHQKNILPVVQPFLNISKVLSQFCNAPTQTNQTRRPLQNEFITVVLENIAANLHFANIKAGI